MTLEEPSWFVEIVGELCGGSTDVKRATQVVGCAEKTAEYGLAIYERLYRLENQREVTVVIAGRSCADARDYTLRSGLGNDERPASWFLYLARAGLP